MIPKIFHRIWLGGKPMPTYFTHWGEIWLKKHPAWTMKLWTEREIYALTNADLFARCQNTSTISDMARYEILYREGGIYLDPDIECRKSIDMLVHGLDFFATWERDGILSTSVIGASKHHKLLQKIVWSSRAEFKASPQDAMGASYLTPKVVGQEGVRILPRETFSPYTKEQYSKFPKKPMIQIDPPDSAYAINHRSSLWYKP